MHVAGVEVPELGGLKDRILRRFLTRESQKEIEKQRILVDVAIAVGGAKQEWIDAISPHWNSYVSLEHGFETDIHHEKEEVEKENLLQVYNKIKNVKVTAKKSKTSGGIIVNGIRDLEKI